MNNMAHLDISMLEKIATVGSRNAKLELLKQLDAGKELLALALDPNITFGVTTTEVDCMSTKMSASDLDIEQASEADFWARVLNSLRQLSHRDLTGNRASDEIVWLSSIAPSVDHAKWLARLINKDLRCGIQVSSLLKVWPGLVTPFEVQLALPYDVEKHQLVGQWFVEPKLDGLRMVIINGVPYTRNGKIIESVDHIIEQLSSVISLKDYVLDGEVMGGGSFDEASGKVRKKGVQAANAIYHVFDLVNASEWTDRQTVAFGVRRKELEATLHSPLPNVQVVRNHRLLSTTEISNFMNLFVKQGFEGAMLKDGSASYQFKRSKHLLKVKDWFSEDGEIVDVIEGRGKYKGKLGAIVVRHQGLSENETVTTEVGSGFDDSQRAAWWEQREDLLGSWVEVKYQNKTPDGKLRFPVFLGFRPDKEA